MKTKFETQKGFSLIEILISIAILSLISVAFFSSLEFSSRALTTTDERETAKNIAEAQMEHIKSLTYDAFYPPMDISSDYPGYSIVTGAGGQIYAESLPGVTDANMQKIEIIVQHESRTILSIEGYRAR
jgi:prepilin-type N-terminal cleavage/methylation domain-containing protein